MRTNRHQHKNQILIVTDRDPNNPNNVILLYTGWSVNAAQEYNSGKGWTREHVWSQSHGELGRDETQGAGTDVHHLRPVDNKVKSKNPTGFLMTVVKNIY